MIQCHLVHHNTTINVNGIFDGIVCTSGEESQLLGLRVDRSPQPTTGLTNRTVNDDVNTIQDWQWKTTSFLVNWKRLGF